MKEYRLKINVPAHPKLGTTIKVGDNGYYKAAEDLVYKPEDYPHIWEKVKGIVTSEDGVELFEGDDYWVVNNTFYKLISRKDTILIGQIFANHLKIFSTKELADSYIEENIRELSLKDIKDILVDNDAHSIGIILEDIRKIIAHHIHYSE